MMKMLLRKEGEGALRVRVWKKVVEKKKDNVTLMNYKRGTAL